MKGMVAETVLTYFNWRGKKSLENAEVLDKSFKLSKEVLRKMRHVVDYAQVRDLDEVFACLSCADGIDQIVRNQDDTYTMVQQQNRTRERG